MEVPANMRSGEVAFPISFVALHAPELNPSKSWFRAEAILIPGAATSGFNRLSDVGPVDEKPAMLSSVYWAATPDGYIVPGE